MSDPIRKVVKGLLGVNLASLGKLLTFGPRGFARASLSAYHVASRIETEDLRKIPVASLRQILGDRTPAITLKMEPLDDGTLPLDQAICLLAILTAEKPQEILEIGTFMGHTTRLMAECLPASMIHTVDLPLEPTAQLEELLPKDDFHLINRRIVGRDFKGQPCEKQITQHFADTAQWDFREAGHSTFFFIDGSHTYEYCKNDSEKCLELCGSKGVFLWHDCDDDHPGVVSPSSAV